MFFPQHQYGWLGVAVCEDLMGFSVESAHTEWANVEREFVVRDNYGSHRNPRCSWHPHLYFLFHLWQVLLTSWTRYSGLSCILLQDVYLAASLASSQLHASSSTPQPQTMTNKYVSRYCQMTRGEEVPLIENHSLTVI